MARHRDIEHATGYIETRRTPEGERYFAQIDSPGFWYGELRETREQARGDGRAECERRGLYVPCFGMTAPAK